MPKTALPKTYYIKTFGCQMNESDSERIASFLEEKNFKPTENIEEADFIVFNTCGVRQTAENRVYGQVHNLRKKNKNCIIVITGCLAHRKDVQRRLKEKADLFLPIDDFFNTKNWNIKNLKFKIPAQKNNSNFQNRYLSTRPRYRNEKNALVPIMTGCNNFCSYCVVPYARGREWSRPPQEIFKEVKDLSKNSCQKITLLGQNVNSYQYRIKNQELRIKKNSHASPFHKGGLRGILSFPELLNNLAKKYPKIKFSFLTSHPKDFSDDLIKVIAQNKNISREIHLPVQSGSDKILKKMNRPYTQKKYLNLIKKIKKQIPDVKFSTDVIVGFPRETKKDFEQTAKIFQDVDFFEAYINKYSPRPGTVAESLGDPISWDEKKKREKTLRKLIKKRIL